MEFIRRLYRTWELFGLVQMLPFPVAGIIGVIAFFDRLPLTYILLAVLIAFASMNACLLWYQNRKLQETPEYKLKFLFPCATRRPTTVNLGFQVRNDALFPIKVKLKEMRTSCLQKIPHKPTQLVKKDFEMVPGELRWFYDQQIDITGFENASITGRLEFSLVYDRSDHLYYKIDRDLDVFITPSGQVNWRDHEEEGQAT